MVFFQNEIGFDSFRNAHAYERLKKHRNPNVIVASYVATGNLLDQVSQGEYSNVVMNGQRQIRIYFELFY